ncbi:hypothetical protein HaLaN_27382, partial [Haematococcus lacustris]
MRGRSGCLGHCPDAIAINDDSSICGRMTYLSRVTFTAKAGQAYWVVVEGYSASCGKPALTVITRPMAPPSPLPPPSPPAPPAYPPAPPPGTVRLTHAPDTCPHALPGLVCQRHCPPQLASLSTLPAWQLRDPMPGWPAAGAASPSISLSSVPSQLPGPCCAWCAAWLCLLHTDPCTPYLLADLPAAGETVYNNYETTCGTANGWNCRPAPDFLYLLPSSEEGDRSITLDTFVYEYHFWNTLLYVIPVQDGTCGQCSGAIASDDDSSFWDNGLSRVTFTAKAGQAYWVLVEGYSASDVGEAVCEDCACCTRTL